MKNNLKKLQIMISMIQENSKTNKQCNTETMQ